MEEQAARMSFNKKLAAAARSEPSAVTSDCLEPEELIELIEQGADSPAALRRMAHLATCAYCQQEFDAMEKTLRMAARAQQIQAAQTTPAHAPPERPSVRAAPAATSLWRRLFVPSAFALGAAVAGLVVYWAAVRPLQIQIARQSAQIREDQQNRLSLTQRNSADLSNLSKALEHHTRILALRQKMGNERDIADSLNNLGLVYQSLGQLDKALEHHTRALALRQKMGNERDIANSLNNLGNVYDSLGQLDKALEHHTRALALKGYATQSKEYAQRMARAQQEKEKAQQKLRSLRAENQALRKRLATRPAPPPSPPVRERGGIDRSVAAAFEALLAGRRFQPRDVAALVGGPERGGDGGPVTPELTLKRPVATFVRDVHPTLEAETLPGATDYKVTVTNPDTGRTMRTVPLSSTRWKVVDALQRGQVYEWQVTARKDGRDVKSPSKRFQVLEKQKSDELARAERAYAGLHLTLGVLYAQAGLLDDAEIELKKLSEADPNHPIAGNLRQVLREARSR